MKSKMICAISALLTPILLAAGNPPTVGIDSVTAGRAFASGQMWDHYTFQGEFGIDNDGVDRDYWGRMDLQGRITEYTIQIDGKDIEIVEQGDTPLPGLPYPTEGLMTDFWISLRAMSGEETVAWGHTWQDRVYKNQAITVILHPESERGFVQYDDDVPSGVTPRLVDIHGNELGWYNHNYGGFEYYLNPLNGPVQVYVMYDNRRVGSFWIEPFEPAERQTDNPINIELVGQVVRVDFDGRRHARLRSRTDGQTLVKDVMVPAKVFILDTQGESLQVSGHNDDGDGLTMTIYDIDNDRLELLDSAQFVPVGYNDFYRIDFRVPRGYGKIMVVVTDDREELEGEFDATFITGDEPLG